MRRVTLTGWVVASFLLAVTPCRLCPRAHAQDIEPRAFSNAPVGLNFLTIGNAVTRGSLSFDPAAPITNAHLTTSSTVLAYTRVVNVWGASGKFDAIVPFAWLSGSAMLDGERITRAVNGLGDARLQLTVNLYGAPALTAREFDSYRQNLIIGAGLQISVPVGQYDPTRVVNLGTNRWSLKPVFGVSKAAGRFTLELTSGVTFYTDNKNFFGGKLRSQAPLYSVQGHVIYNFGRGIWVSVDGTFFTGGRTTVGGIGNRDLQQNWRFGGTLAVPLSRQYSLKAYASQGVYARTGHKYVLFGIAVQYLWGAGM